MEEDSSRTELSDLGEFGLIAHLSKHIELKNPSSIEGIGDDAAVIETKDMHTVVTTDMLCEGVHFDLTFTPLKHLGYKAVVVNLSDVYAMNAEPTQITVSIAVSNRFSLEAVEELYSGILLACNRYGVDLVGGDTSSSLSGLIINITAIGQARKEDIVLRSGAQENDLICVSGDLGGAYMGLQVLEREKAVFKEDPNMQPDLDGHDYILERQLKPEARMDVIQLLKDFKIKPTAMIDISDGLSSEQLHISSASQLGCHLYEEKIPIDPTTVNLAMEFNIDPTLCALSGGEDYELLFTISQKDYDKIKSDPDITVIGHMLSEGEGCFLISRDGSSHELTAQGWDAFLDGQNEPGPDDLPKPSEN
ncbi:MAG TPA: thiamine-phosphate kinase [Flavobacteriales bacterium]|nr:thiamine-phosphate kinase [Flavobacteriales bacterium]